VKRISALALVAMFALSACSGASQTASLPALPQAPAIAAVVLHAAAPDRGGKKHKLVPIRISITMPHTKKRKGHHGRYVSSGATQMVITLNKINGSNPPPGMLTTVTTQLTSTGTNPPCTINGDGTQTCIVSGPPVPVGSDDITFTAEDGATPTPNALSTVEKLFTVDAGIANSFSATLLGIPATFGISTAPVTAGTAAVDQPVLVQVFDASGAEIVGTADYATPVLLTSPNTAAAFHGGNPSITLLSPEASVTLSYSGLSVTSFNLSASATGATPGTGLVGVTNFPVVAVCADGGNDVCATGPQVNLYDVSPNAGSTANLTVTQTGWTPLGAYTAHDVTEADNCGLQGTSPQNIATVAQTGSTAPGGNNAGNGTVFSVTTLGAPAAGATCTATFTGGAGLSSNVTITYTVSGVSVNGRHRAAKSKPNRN
jgi:hypothetical protein